MACEERDAETPIPEQVGEALVGVVVVRLDGYVADVQALPDQHFRHAVAFAELQQRDVLRAQREGGEVQLAGGGHGGDELGVIEDDLGVDGVDVR